MKVLWRTRDHGVSVKVLGMDALAKQEMGMCRREREDILLALDVSVGV